MSTLWTVPMSIAPPLSLISGIRPIISHRCCFSRLRRMSFCYFALLRCAPATYDRSIGLMRSDSGQHLAPHFHAHAPHLQATRRTHTGSVCPTRNACPARACAVTRKACCALLYMICDLTLTNSRATSEPTSREAVHPLEGGFMAHRVIRRGLIAVGSLIALLLILLVAGIILVRASFPRTRGTIKVPGLHSSVEVLRDAQGVPQIYATDTHDVFFAQGYVHAQDRFWQMDFWRHIGSGRLSEMFGESQLETDKFLRTMGWARVVEQELAALAPEARAALVAYAEGVNAYLAQHRGPSLSLEYAVLGLLTPGYTPEPWTPLNSLTWAKAMAWDLGGNMKLELERAVLLRKLGPQRLAELFPAYPAENPIIVAGPYAARHGGYAFAAELEAALPALSRVGARLQTLYTLLGGGLEGIGSNNWVVSGSRTTSGAPLLADDMHLGLRIPSIWYENGLHCEPVGAACPLEVVGYSFAGLPGVIVGHNQDIAWGVTNVGPDVQDLYLERLNPQNPDQYEVNGQWVDMTIVEETIQVAGSEPVLLTVRTTRHGPILSDVDDAYAGLAAAHSGATGEQYAVALRWTALDPTSIVRSELRLNQPHNWDEFRAALRDWDVPSQNFVYADRAGNIGYQTPGRIPVRAAGDGRLPVPGWTDEFEWQGYIPFEELPSLFNPPQGFIATANNAVG